MRETQEIHDSLIGKLEDNLDNQIKSGSMLDMFAHAVAEENRELYQEIEDAKNPHLFTNTWGEDLDSLGYCCKFVVRDSISARGDKRGSITGFIPKISKYD